jgi:hypothetical protein
MQIQTAIDQIRDRLAGIADNYNRLVLLVGDSCSGRTTAIRGMADADGLNVLNLGAELSLRLLDLGERQRILQLPALLEGLLATFPSRLTLLDNTEILFNPMLKQDPLRLLQRMSRDRTIVASWLGEVHGHHLSYASPEHPEFRRYLSDDLLIVSLNHAHVVR